MEYLDSGIFQIAGPADIAVLVEARFQFDHRGYFFFLRGRDESGNDQRMLVGTIQRLFDRKHARVLGRRFDERNHGIVGIEGMMQQDVMTAKFLEQILRLGGEPEFARDKSFELEVGMPGCS